MNARFFVLSALVAFLLAFAAPAVAAQEGATVVEVENGMCAVVHAAVQGMNSRVEVHSMKGHYAPLKKGVFYILETETVSPPWELAERAVAFPGREMVVCANGARFKLRIIGATARIEPMPLNGDGLAWFKSRAEATAACQSKGGVLAEQNEPTRSWIETFSKQKQRACFWTSTGNGVVSCGKSSYIGDGHGLPNSAFAALCIVNGELTPALEPWPLRSRLW